MMRVVQGCVALLPVVMSTVLLQLAPVTGLRYPQSPDTSPQQLRQYLQDVPPDDLHHSPDDHPTPSWHNSAKPQQYHLDGLPDDDPDALPTDFPLQQYLQGGPSVLQDGDTIQQYPRTTYHEPGSWWHPAAPHPALPNDPYAHRNTHHAYDNTNDALRNSLHLYDEDEDDEDVHPNSIAAQQAAGEATHHDVGDTYRNLREGEAAGEEEELMASPVLPCWHYLPPEPTWCPSILFQVLGHQLARVSRPSPSWRSPPTPRGVPEALHWLRKPPSKRYLGIELPDYIATSYSSIKTDNAHYLTKLHQLKQRMRNAGK